MIDGCEVIRELRKATGMTLREYGELSGINHMTISNIEHDRNKMTLYTFQKLIECLGYKIVLQRIEDDDSNKVRRPKKI